MAIPAHRSHPTNRLRETNFRLLVTPSAANNNTFKSSDGGRVSAVLNPEETVTTGSGEPGVIDIREGDWKAYLYFTGKCRGNQALLDRYGGLVPYRRACAMAYLGRRAQLHGGVCSTRHPHIMTPQFIADLEHSNKAQRYGRYPWLEALMNVLAEIEKEKITVEKRTL